MEEGFHGHGGVQVQSFCNFADHRTLNSYAQILLLFISPL